jgi:hypothetical protein
MKSTCKFFPPNNQVLASKFVLNLVGVTTVERPGPSRWEASTLEKSRSNSLYFIANRNLYSTILRINGIDTIVNGYPVLVHGTVHIECMTKQEIKTRKAFFRCEFTHFAHLIKSF